MRRLMLGVKTLGMLYDTKCFENDDNRKKKNLFYTILSTSMYGKRCVLFTLTNQKYCHEKSNTTTYRKHLFLLQPSSHGKLWLKSDSLFQSWSHLGEEISVAFVQPQGLGIDYKHLPAIPKDIDTQINQVIEWLSSVIESHGLEVTPQGKDWAERSTSQWEGEGLLVSPAACHITLRRVKGHVASGRCQSSAQFDYARWGNNRPNKRECWELVKPSCPLTLH